MRIDPTRPRRPVSVVGNLACELAELRALKVTLTRENKGLSRDNAALQARCIRLERHNSSMHSALRNATRMLRANTQEAP